MEKVIRNLLVVTGLLIASSVAFLPLSSYAVSNVGGVFDCNGVTNPDGGTASNYTGAEAPRECATADIKNTENEDGTINTDGATEVQVTVKEPLALDAADPVGFDDRHGNKVMQVFPNMIRYGRLYANVRSARSFTIALSAENPYLTNEEDDSFVIPARDTPVVNKSGWGVATGQIAELDAIDFESQTYQALNSTPETFYDGAATEGFKIINFPVAVSISSNLPQGAYSTEVTVTAATKD